MLKINHKTFKSS